MGPGGRRGGVLCNHKIFRNLIFNTGSNTAAAQSIVLNLLPLKKRTSFDVISLPQNESFSYVVLT